METIEVQLLANRTNMPVIKHPGRHYPGVLIQGDTLAIIYSMVEYALQGDPSEQAKRVDDVRRTLAEFVLTYEAALTEHGIKLPYNESMTASAKGR